MKTVVVSGINIDSGGALSVLTDCLAAAEELLDRHRLVALVHDRKLLPDVDPRIELREFPRSKRRWLRRLWYEYVAFRRLSRELTPHLWFSLHDVTPNVQATRRAVYCHNPAPFHRLAASDFALDPSLVAFRLLYGRLYGINIRHNDTVVVQQQWMREEFRKRYRLGDVVVVAHPRSEAGPASGSAVVPGEFVYPCFPRVFKNVEVACRAFARLGDTGARLVLTLDGTENRYARRLRKRFGNLANIEFAGRRSRAEVFGLYERACALVFPSRLETWGMPLSEFRATGRPVFAADLPYARETLAGYEHAAFFDPDDDAGLAARLRAFLNEEDVPGPALDHTPAAPFAPDWRALWALLLGGEEAP